VATLLSRHTGELPAGGFEEANGEGAGGAMVPSEVLELERRGQVFCFLPLPVDSGLPVFVNGYFELSSNRRDIWFGAGEGAPPCCPHPYAQAVRASPGSQPA
jgi:sacsin